MYNFDGDRLIIDSTLSYDDCGELKDFLLDKLDYIEEIELEITEDGIPSSALIALLLSVKKTSPGLKIPVLEKGLQYEKFGKISITTE